MTFPVTKPLEFLRRRVRLFVPWFMLVGGAMWLAGCGTPPSVLPLLEVSEQTLRAEAERLEEDNQRDAQWLDQTRRALHQAYQQDLHEQGELTSTWVRDATQAYVVAREELVRHEMRLREQRARRRDNLHAAAEATHRAAAILMQQDQLITQLIDEDVWALLDPHDW